MTNYSRIEMAFELLKASVSAGSYFSCGETSRQSNEYRAKWAFEQTDAFIEEIKRQGIIK